MSEENKINGLRIGNARVSDLLNTAIKRVDGVAVNTTAFSTGLLDTYGSAAAAYSVRRLNSNYTGACMRVRRDSDNVEADIGFNAAGNLDVLAIRDHCGSANGFVRYWYGQEASGGTGSGNDAGQSTASAQPQIYNGTAVITENGKPIIQSDSGAFLNTDVDDSLKIFSVARIDLTGVFAQWRTEDGSGQVGDGWLMAADSGSTTAFYDSTHLTLNAVRKNGASYSFATKNRGDIWTDFNAQHIAHFDVTTSRNDFTMGYKHNPSSFPMYSQQELILYPSTSTHTPSDIESNQNSYFSIY